MFKIVLIQFIIVILTIDLDHQQYVIVGEVERISGRRNELFTTSVFL